MLLIQFYNSVQTKCLQKGLHSEKVHISWATALVKLLNYFLGQPALNLPSIYGRDMKNLSHIESVIA